MPPTGTNINYSSSNYNSSNQIKCQFWKKVLRHQIFPNIKLSKYRVELGCVLKLTKSLGELNSKTHWINFK